MNFSVWECLSRHVTFWWIYLFLSSRSYHLAKHIFKFEKWHTLIVWELFLRTKRIFPGMSFLQVVWGPIRAIKYEKNKKIVNRFWENHKQFLVNLHFSAQLLHKWIRFILRFSYPNILCKIAIFWTQAYVPKLRHDFTTSL